MAISTEAEYQLFPNLLRLEEIGLRPSDGFPRHCGIPMTADDFVAMYGCDRCEKVAARDDISYVRSRLGFPVNF